MARIQLKVKSPYGEISVEGDSFDEVKKLLEAIGIEERHLQRFLKSIGEQSDLDKEAFRPNQESQTQSLPSNLISKLPVMTSSDVVLSILLLERVEASKKDLISRSRDLGKPISEEWMSKHFSGKLKGLVTSTIKDDQWIYRLSEQGKLTAKERMRELTETNSS